MTRVFTPSDAERAVEEIRTTRSDDLAHQMEDWLRTNVLREIAGGLLTYEDAKRLATIALSTEELTFSRWYT